MFVLPMSNIGLFQSFPWYVYPWISFYYTECHPVVVQVLQSCPWGFKSPLEPTYSFASLCSWGWQVWGFNWHWGSFLLLNIPSDNAGRFILWGSLRSILRPEHECNLFNCLKPNQPKSWCGDFLLVARIVRHSCYHQGKQWLEENLISKYVVQQL